MKRLMGSACMLLCVTMVSVFAQEPEWNPANVKSCDRACLVGFMERYMNAIYKHDPKLAPPLAKDYRMTENTGVIEIGEGMLWRRQVEPTTFNLYAADPIAGQVGLQARVNIQGQNSLISVRLKIDRGRIQEIEHLWAGGVNVAANELLTTPRTTLTTDIPAAQRTPRDVMIWAANSYFDALEGDNGKIAAFAKDCARHENGYQTVNNPPPGGRMMPGPALPNPSTPQGQEQLRFSMLTCEQQISAGTFSYMKHIRPRRALIVDEQKGLVSVWALFIHDGTRRNAPPNAPPPGMLQNLVTVETFGIRGGLIHEVEVFPFVTQPYGLGDGWTPGSGR
jgi:hypothetical protein